MPQIYGILTGLFDANGSWWEDTDIRNNPGGPGGEVVAPSHERGFLYLAKKDILG